MNIIEVMTDPELFAPTFKGRLLLGDSWKNWRAFLAALFALPMDAEAKEIYQRHTGRTDEPAEQFRESFIIVGRRGGKSLVAALVAVYMACFRDYRNVLAPGETGVVMILAADRRQARVILGYIDAFLSIPLLASMVVDRLKESITLDNRVQIEIHTSSFRATRGYTLIAAICDEIAFWPTDESASPDTEVLNALRPGLATTNGLLLAISSPYARKGELWRNFKEHYGRNASDVLIWKANSREMNGTLNPAVVAAAYLRDASSARAEYGAEFRDDVEDFMSLEVVEARVVAGRFELPFSSSHSYTGFCDPSGGRADSMTLAVAHVERGMAVLDCLREIQAPFSPEQACAEFSDTLKRYRVSEVIADKYAGEWPREQFQKRGVSYRVAEKTRSEIYLEFLPILMSAQCELLDNQRLITQLVRLERRTARSGRDSIDHPPGSQDDLSNSAAGALVAALSGASQHVYGLLELYTSGRIQQIIAQIPGGNLDINSAGAWKEASPPPCPKCGASCVVRIGGVGVRCNQCAYTDSRGLPEPQRITRADILSGRKFQSLSRRF